MIRNLQYFYIVLFFLAFQGLAIAQPIINITPGEIEFENKFDRLVELIIENNGNSFLKIDSLSFNRDIFKVRYNEDLHLPVNISAGHHLSIDFILSAYNYVSSADTVDTLIIYSNDPINPAKPVKIKIDFHDDNINTGIIKGIVSSHAVPLDSAKVIFYYERQYHIKTIRTDINGEFQVTLPEGEYVIAADKDGYDVQFFYNKTSLSDANTINLSSGSTKIISFDLNESAINNNTVSGLILDKITGAPLPTGLVVVRKGKHTPNKTNGTNNQDMYAGFIRPDGTFSIKNIPAGYYYIQAFSDFYIPAYYSTNGSFVYWNNTNVDSIDISSNLTNISISLPRDSAYGAGNITGSITSSIGNLKYSQIIVFARSTVDNSIFNYSLVDSLGNFNINNLPANNYNLIAQSIGLTDASSATNIVINQVMPMANNVNLTFTSVVGGIEKPGTVPDKIQLYPNYPNPFNPTTTISFYLPGSANVNVKVYNIIGKEVETLASGYMQQGDHKVIFNAKGLSSGVYFVNLRSNGISLLRKIVLLK